MAKATQQTSVANPFSAISLILAGQDVKTFHDRLVVSDSVQWCTAIAGALVLARSQDPDSRTVHQLQKLDKAADQLAQPVAPAAA